MYQNTVIIETDGFCDIKNITSRIVETLQNSEFQEGLVNMSIPGSTASLTTIEFEEGAVADLKRAIKKLAPRDQEYKHNLKWGDGNGFSHVRSALMGPSVTMPFREGELQNGTWQQVVLLDFDNNPRSRKVIISVLEG